MNNSLIKPAIRGFHSSAIACKASISIKQPVHHKIKFKKSAVSERYRQLLTPKNSVLSSAFRPVAVSPDRLLDHHNNTVASDLLLINYLHGSVEKKGLKHRPWDGSSPYHLNRPARPPRGRVVATPDIKVRDWTNVPYITGISINCWVPAARENPDLSIPAKLQLQQITGVKPKTVYSKTNVPAWRLRPGVAMGAKVLLKGRPLHQFLATLSEIILPRSKTFNAISNGSGDRFGNITFGLTAEDVRYFPEIEGNQDLWPKTFGMDVTIQTSAQVDPDARILLSAYNLPFAGAETFPSRW